MAAAGARPATFRCEVAGRQAQPDAEGGAGAEADRHSLDGGGDVAPQLTLGRQLGQAAEDEPRPGEEDWIEEPEDDDETSDGGPHCNERGHGAEPEREHTPGRECGPSQARLHQRGHVAHE